MLGLSRHLVCSGDGGRGSGAAGTAQKGPPQVERLVGCPLGAREV